MGTELPSRASPASLAYAAPPPPCVSAVMGSNLPDPHSYPSPLSEPGHGAAG